MNNYPKPDKEIAAFWGVVPRTLFRWKADSAPIHDYDQMLRWLATRKNLPCAVMEKVKLPPGNNVSLPVTSGAPGAAAALKRLEEAEIAAFERLQVAIKGGNPLIIKEAREGWIKLGESLRKFDLLVEASRREAGDLIPRDELIRFIHAFCTGARLEFHNRADWLTTELEGKTKVDICLALREVFTASFFHGMCNFIGKSADQRLVETARKEIEHTYGCANHRDDISIEIGVSHVKGLEECDGECAEFFESLRKTYHDARKLWGLEQ